MICMIIVLCQTRDLTKFQFCKLLGVAEQGYCVWVLGRLQKIGFCNWVTSDGLQLFGEVVSELLMMPVSKSHTILWELSGEHVKGTTGDILLCSCVCATKPYGSGSETRGAAEFLQKTHHNTMGLYLSLRSCGQWPSESREHNSKTFGNHFPMVLQHIFLVPLAWWITGCGFCVRSTPQGYD